jgi:hypothetical protein
MPYSKVSEARIKKLNGVPLTLEQVNAIAKQADAIGGDYGWPTAIKNFKRTHTISDGAWVAKKKSDEDKEIHELLVTKEDDGRYRIVGISTADIRDREGETFGVEAMDYDITEAKTIGDYPEFRMFHKPYLGIGKVTKMSRIGIFAVDEGYAYDDAFSKEVCEKVLKDNDGKWRMSRGFYVVEASGGCPNCGNSLVIHLQYKGVLKDIRFRKARTFDVTVTDVPCVPMTSVSAFKDNVQEVSMNKKDLRVKLLDAGLTPEVIDERLKLLTDDELKEFEGIPQAVLLKELGLDEAGNDGGEELFVLDPEVLKDFAAIVRKQVAEVVKETMTEVLNDLEIDLTDVQVKEVDGLVELKEQVEAIQATLNTLVERDEDRLAKMLKETPRSGRLRIMRSKGGGKPKMEDEEDMDEEEGDEEGVPVPPKKKSFVPNVAEGVVIGSDGQVAENMTNFILGGV